MVFFISNSPPPLNLPHTSPHSHTRITPTHLLSNLFPLSCDHCVLDSPLTVRSPTHSLRPTLAQSTPDLFPIYFPVSKPLISFLASNPTILTAKLIARMSLSACKTKKKKLSLSWKVTLRGLHQTLSRFKSIKSNKRRIYRFHKILN